MRQLFQSRVFIAVALMLLLGAVRCMDACQLPDRQPVKSCHQTPDSSQHPSSAKTCGQLALEAPPAHDGGDAPILLVVSHGELQQEAATAILNGRRVPAALARPGPLLLPLRL